MVERGPEKAGVGGSIPSLATTLEYTYADLNISRPFGRLILPTNSTWRFKEQSVANKALLNRLTVFVRLKPHAPT